MPPETASSDQNTVEVHSLDTARALLMSVMNDDLQPFRHAPLSPAQLSQRTGAPLYQVMRFIKKWLALGVLVVHDEQKRAGRPVKRYALKAQQFFIPRETLPIEEVLDTLSGPIRTQMTKQLGAVLAQQSAVSGTQICLTPKQHHALLATAPGQLWDASQAGAPATAYHFMTLKLDYPDACLLNQELDQLLSRYASKGGSQSYLCSVQLTPVVNAS